MNDHHEIASPRTITHDLRSLASTVLHVGAVLVALVGAALFGLGTWISPDEENKHE